MARPGKIENTEEGYDEKQLFEEFSKLAGYLGGGCYMIPFLNRSIYNKDTGALFREWKSYFTKKNGRYYYSFERGEESE